MTAVRFYLDEGVQVQVARQMVRRGIDAVTVRELGLLGDSDLNHLRRASQMGRVLCTYDTDFLRLDAEGYEHAGILFGFHDRTTIGDWIRAADQLIASYSAEEMANQVLYV
jgi:hypothetical protein